MSTARLPYLADIKRHSLEDGPGIRSVVFFKGCPLHCDFCHNPEMQRAEVELLLRAERCLACGECVAACPRGAISLDQAVRVDRVRCEVCGRCTAACPSSALALVGRRYAIDELVEVLLRDEAYYRRSGGGVTFSGGECTLFPEYLVRLARALKARAVHLVAETCGEFDGAWFADELLPLLDLVYFDVKLADARAHRRHTGRDNARILANLQLLLRLAPERTEVRMPLVPGITATSENLQGVAACLRRLGVRRATLLPYNPLGGGVAVSLGRARPAVSASFMERAELDAALATFAARVG